MPSLEAVCGKLFGSSGWMPKVLLGGLLSFIPVLNLFALGYLLEYTRRLRRFNQWELPDWNKMELPILLISGIRMLLLFLTWVGLPLLVGWILSILLQTLSFGLLGIVSYFPLAVTGFAGPFLLLSSIHAYLRDGLFSDSWQIRRVVREAFDTWPKLYLPILAFWGIFLLALPLYGLSLFMGLWVLLAYSTILQLSL